MFSKQGVIRTFFVFFTLLVGVSVSPSARAFTVNCCLPNPTAFGPPGAGATVEANNDTITCTNIIGNDPNAYATCLSPTYTLAGAGTTPFCLWSTSSTCTVSGSGTVCPAPYGACQQSTGSSTNCTSPPRSISPIYCLRSSGAIGASDCNWSYDVTNCSGTGTGTSSGTTTGTGSTCVNNLPCPPKYSPLPGTTPASCRPDLPTLSTASGSEYYYDPNADGVYAPAPLANVYPVCGINRFPVTADGSYATLSTASSMVPLDSGNPGINWFPIASGYTSPEPYYYSSSATVPLYEYSSLAHCACLSTYDSPRAGPTTTSTGTSVQTSISQFPDGSGISLFYPDTYDAVAAQVGVYPGSTPPPGFVNYGPVAIDKSATVDGRLGTEYGASTPTSKCGCPNINEVPALNDPSYQTTGAAMGGTHCVPVINDPHVVLAAFNPATDAGLVITPEVMDSTGHVVTKILLPRASNFNMTQTYTRKIWRCAYPYVYSGGSTPQCVLSSIRSAHECDSTSKMPGTLAWTDVINKKLACCMNSESSPVATTSPPRYDCAQNSTTSYATFWDLWTSTDSAQDGSQPNALLLYSGFQAQTGFYTLEGRRCSQFTEFGGAIPNIKINPMIMSAQQDSVSSGGSAPIPGDFIFKTPATFPTLPTGNSLTAVTTTTLGKGFPSTSTDYLQCPVVVLAAAQYSCQASPQLPAFQTSITFPSDGQVKCVNSNSIKIHLMIMQYADIAGMLRLPTVDTVVDGTVIPTLNLQRLFPVGASTCPAGTTWSNGYCVY